MSTSTYDKGIAAALRGPTQWPTGWRWIEGKLYRPAGVSAFKHTAQRKAHALRQKEPHLSVRVKKEPDGYGFTYRIFQEVP